MDTEKLTGVLKNAIGYELALMNGDSRIDDGTVKQSQKTQRQLDRIMTRVNEHLAELNNVGG